MEQEMPMIGSDEQASFLGGGDLIMLSGSTTLYNCFSYAFHDGLGDPTDPANMYNGSGYACWDNDPNDDIAMGGYQVVSSASPGDIAIHYHDNNNNGQYDFGESIVHASKVKTVSGGEADRIVGKWGAGGLYESDLHDPQIDIYYGCGGAKVAYLRN